MGVVSLSSDVVASLAARIHQAERTRTQIRQLSLEYPAMTVEDAYAIQRTWVATKVADILPMLQKAADAVPEFAKGMATVVPDKL